MTSIEPANILIVDDKPANLVALETVLRSPGLNLVRATSGNEALSKLLDHEFACVLLDVQMPEMNGFELARIIRNDERTKYVPILFASADLQGESDVLSGYEMGAVDYLLKPLNAAIVRSKVSVFAELYRKERARQRAEAALAAQAMELQRSNEELDRYASIVAHDLQAPVRRIGSCAEIFAQDYSDKLDEGGARLIKMMRENAGRMQALITDLLAYSRVGKKLTRARVDLNDTVTQVLDDLSPLVEESGASVSCGQLPVLTASTLELRQLMQNLIGNALKYRKKTESPRVQISAEKQKGEWIFRVRDNGIGIDPRHKDKLFVLFSRLHNDSEYPGTGIGLAVCKKIVARLGGNLWVESEPGKGSTFCFTLPDEGEQAAV